MGELVHDDAVALAAIHPVGDGVTHGAGWHVHSGFMARQLCRNLTQLVDRWVFARLLIADFGLRHGFAHAGRWAV